MAFGRLERTQGPKPMSDINVTPLVDVMLVLVVIFILSAPLLAASLRLDLPKASTATPSEQLTASISVQLNLAGVLLVEDRPVDPSTLRARLKRAAEQNPETEVQLSVDQALPYARVVELIDAAQSAGLSRIAFVALPEKSR